MTNQLTEPSVGGHGAPAPAQARPGNRWTVAGGVALLTICVLHTLVFAAHPYWAEWLAGPTREAPLAVEPMLLFWALPGGLVVPGAALALLLIGLGRRGEAVPLWLPVTLLAWAGCCVWMVGGPTGFMMVTVPAVLLLIGRARRRH